MSTPTLPRKQGSTIRLPFTSHRRSTQARHEVTRSEGVPTTPEIQVAYHTKNTLRRVSFSSAKRKKLVVNGIAPHDTARFEALKRWCEVRTISYFLSPRWTDSLTLIFRDTELW